MILGFCLDPVGRIWSIWIRSVWIRSVWIRSVRCRLSGSSLGSLLRFLHSVGVFVFAPGLFPRLFSLVLNLIPCGRRGAGCFSGFSQWFWHEFSACTTMHAPHQISGNPSVLIRENTQNTRTNLWTGRGTGENKEKLDPGARQPSFSSLNKSSLLWVGSSLLIVIGKD